MKNSFINSVLILLFSTSIALGGDISGKVSAPKAKYSANTVVYIVNSEVPDNGWDIQSNAVVDQKGLEFIPHVIPVIKGTQIKFNNSDNVLHNVFSPDKVADRFDLGTYPQNESKSHKFTKEGDAVLLCNVHPEMEAYVVVLQNPYFSITDKDGNFVIRDIPPGTYEISAWNEKYKSKSQTVTVDATGSLTVALALKK